MPGHPQDDNAGGRPKGPARAECGPGVGGFNQPRVIDRASRPLGVSTTRIVTGWPSVRC